MINAMFGFFILCITWGAGVGLQYKDPNLPPVTTKAPAEPVWVTLLRNNIKTAVKYKGFDKARQDIKQMIDNVDQQINGDRALRQRDNVASLRSFTDGMYESNNNAMDRQSSLTSKWEPRWEKDLKNYIKGLIGQYGKSHLDDYVRPVVGAIETSNNIVIRDIDVNPYGEVSVNWKQTKDTANMQGSDGYGR